MLYFNSWRFRKPKPPSEESIRGYRERLLNHRWDELQEHFGLAIPEPIKNLYKQTTLLTTQNVVFHEKCKEWYVAEFCPADTQTLEGIWSDVTKSKVFPFAVDSFGDCYYVELTGKDSDRRPVMYYHHDGSDVDACERLTGRISGIIKANELSSLCLTGYAGAG